MNSFYSNFFSCPKVTRIYWLPENLLENIGIVRMDLFIKFE